MSSNGTEDASADLERYKLYFCVVNHDFIRTTEFLSLYVRQGVPVDDFLKAVLHKYEHPRIFDLVTAKFTMFLADSFLRSRRNSTVRVG